MKRWTASGVLSSARTFLLRRKSESSDPAEEGTQAPAALHWEYPVLGYAALVDRTKAVGAIDRLRIQLGFPREVFDQTALPAIEAYVTFVQLLPAPQSPGHLHAGGMITWAIEVANRALDFRRGQILPRGAAPEVIGAQAHRWTYAVFVAALLHGIGTQLARLRILIRDGQGALRTWSPAAGSIADCGAVSYRITILDRPESSHAVGPSGVLQFLYRFVPAPVLAWMTEDPDLMPELAAVLSGTPSESTGAIGELIARASVNEDSADRPITVKAPASDRATVTTEDSVDGDAPPLGADTRAHPDGAAPDARSRSDEEPAQNSQERSSTPNTRGDSAPYTDSEVPHVELRNPSSRQAPRHDPKLDGVLDLPGRFIVWLQQGIVERRLRVNHAGALVHFVPEGMLLVSPRIFREFVAQVGVEKMGYPLPLIPDSQHIAKWVQRRVLRAGWHLQAEGDINILTYEVIRADRAVSTLSGVVILDPGRFIKPLPPLNPFLVRQITARRHG